MFGAKRWGPRALLTVPLAALALTGCGGGGGSSAAPPVVLPTPAPTPTPTPTPAPSPAYPLATDFTGDRDYPGWGVESVAAYTPPPAGSPAGTAGTRRYLVNIANETRAAGFTYAVATNSYTVRWFDLIKTYGPTRDFLFQDRIPISAVGDFTRSPAWNNDESTDYTRYFGAISWSELTGNNSGVFPYQTRNFISLYGVTTQPSDLPASGVANFRFFPFLGFYGPAGTSLYTIPQRNLAVSIDWATGAIRGTFILEPSNAAPAGTTTLTITVEGSVDKGSSRASGRFFSATSGYAGSFTGAVFGPRGREFGFAYRIDNANANGGAGGEGLWGVTGGRQLGF